MRVQSIAVTEELKSLWKETAKLLKGSARRQYMAKVVAQLGYGGQVWAQRELGWNRGTIRKGEREVSSGQAIRDAFERRGRKAVEEQMPELRERIRAIVEPQTQADPSLQSSRLYARISAARVRRELVERYGYGEEELPSSEWIRRRLNRMGYRLKRVQKTKPQKVIPETSAILAKVTAVNERADAEAKTLRISIDAKATVKIGDYDRGGAREC
jgi:hypothetical protein